jgi:signal transduction histidine kinase
VRRRLLLGSLGLAARAVTTFFVPAALSLRSADRAAQEVELLSDAADAAARIEPAATRLPASVARDAEHDYAVYSERGPRLDGVGPERPDQVVARALRGTTATGRVGGLRVAAVPLSGGHVLRAAEPASEADGHTRDAVLRLAAIALATVAGAGIAAWLLARFLTRPVVVVRDLAVRLGHGDFTISAPEPSGVTELDELTTALVASADRIGSLLDRERQLTSDVSHELRTPLTGLRLAVETELASPRDDRTEILQEALGAIDRLASTVTGMLELARDEPPRTASTEVGPIVERAVDRWRDPLARDGRIVAVLGGTSAHVRARAQAISTVLDVALDNAHRHGAGTVDVELVDAPGSVRVLVRDEGRCDLSDDELFGRRRSGAASTGIGLHLARTIAEHDGARFRRTVVEPTTFELLLPTDPPTV